MKRTATLAVAALALTACGSSDSSSGGDEQKSITVAAAASLGTSFEQIAEDFESENSNVDVKLTFAGSSNLAAQLKGGAGYDVFASANQVNMDKVSTLVDGEPVLFATNTLTIVTPPDNPGNVTGLADLGKESLAVVVCAPQVPCGDAAVELAQQEGVTLAPDSEESKVTDVLAKVRTGEADAGLVYVTDATGAGQDVKIIKAEGADKVVNNYPIALMSQSEAPEAAQAFIDHVTSSAGQQVLADEGFGSP